MHIIPGNILDKKAKGQEIPTKSAMENTKRQDMSPSGAGSASKPKADSENKVIEAEIERKGMYVICICVCRSDTSNI
ncbi:hypothetical protein TL16_g02683 [Triparma laevis f. inornata]|uniref:Uncharacterized protein n=1 Tax=Triparma laevis f. inornata TaxID=1714386 RepID=A0A9W6ZQT4_9STRA|nr:hypothetical protein TL16_g02683 [Triparma laevis f. inornata]